MNFEKYLPVGTVVLLKNGKKRVMIAGFAVISETDNKVYDYGGVLYPEGFISSDKTLLFNHNQIDKIYYLGLQDEEELSFVSNLKKRLGEN